MWPGTLVSFRTALDDREVVVTGVLQRAFLAEGGQPFGRVWVLPGVVGESEGGPPVLVNVRASHLREATMEVMPDELRNMTEGAASATEDE